MGVRGGAEPQSAYHWPPACSIAFSKARLDGVRFVPELRRICASHTTAQRRSTATPCDSSLTVARLVFKVLNRIVATGLFTKTALNTGHVKPFAQGEQRARLTQHFRRPA